MPSLKDASVLIVKEYPNRYIGISSLLLSLGVKPYRMVNLNDPTEAMKRTFHQRFDILICDQNYRNQQFKASDIIEQLRFANVIEQRTVIVMDCRTDVIKDSSYYLADVPMHAESNQREIADTLRSEFERKNTITSLLENKPWHTEQDMEKRYRSFAQQYPKWQYDLILSRGHYCLSNKRTKEATELYGALLKLRTKKDPTVEVSHFLNALALNGQVKEAQMLHNKFSTSERKLGQPFAEIGAVLQLDSGELAQAYQSLEKSQQQYGMNLVQRTAMAAIALVLAKYDQALDLLSVNLKNAEQLNRDVAQHMMNYLFALVMSWMVNPSAGALYQKKFNQLREQLSCYRLSEVQSYQLSLLIVHRDYMLQKPWRVAAQKVLANSRLKLANSEIFCQLHALYISALLGNEASFIQLRETIVQDLELSISEPMKAQGSKLIRQLNWARISSLLDMRVAVTTQHSGYVC